MGVSQRLIGRNVLLAYSFPLLSVFWSLLMFAGFILWIFIVVWCFIDNFRRRDHHGVAKALWFVFIVFVPVIGVIAYIIARPAAVDLETVA
jgi:quinol-cytochrome oxidoreductase complex cytochrome b subunit